MWQNKYLLKVSLKRDFICYPARIRGCTSRTLGRERRAQHRPALSGRYQLKLNFWSETAQNLSSISYSMLF
jgi:hypothetical protein